MLEILKDFMSSGLLVWSNEICVTAYPDLNNLQLLSFMRLLVTDSPGQGAASLPCVTLNRPRPSSAF